MPSSPLLDAYLKEDRQWPRRHRIAHAQFMQKLYVEDGRTDGVKFFAAVLKANGART